METRTIDMVDSVETLEAAIGRVRAAQRIFAGYTQDQVDKIFLARQRIRRAFPWLNWLQRKPVWE